MELVPVEPGGIEVSEDVTAGVAEETMVGLGVGGLEVAEELEVPEEAIVPVASVTITVSVFGSVMEASSGPSSPQANGKAGSNVAIPHADAAKLVELIIDESLVLPEDIEAAELAALALVVPVPGLDDAVRDLVPVELTTPLCDV